MNSRQRSTIILVEVLALASLVLSSCRGPAQLSATATSTRTAPLARTPTPRETPTPIETAPPNPFAIVDEHFAGGVQSCNTEAEITGVDGDSLEVSPAGSTISMVNGEWALFCSGARHRWIGTLTYAGYTFASDSVNPLQFQLLASGYVNTGGSGKVTLPNGVTVILGMGNGPLANWAPFDKIYFEDEFNDDSRDWSTGDVAGDYWVGSRLVRGGVLDWDGTSVQGMSSVQWPSNPGVPDELSDVMVSVVAKLGNPEMDGFYGLVVRARDDYNYYALVLDSEQMFAFFLNSNGERKTLIDWTANPYVSEDGWNTMTVAASGRHFSLFFNDRLLSETEDATIASGKNGIMVDVREAGEKLQVQFDGFQLRIPSTPPTEEPSVAGVNTPPAHWKGIPIMPGALVGRTDLGDYIFSTTATEAEVKAYYTEELGKLGWTIQTSVMELEGLDLAFTSPAPGTWLHITIDPEGHKQLVRIHMFE